MTALLDDALRTLRADGVVVVPDMLDATRTAAARAALLEAAAESERRGIPTFMPVLDPNDRNVRVFNLLDLHAIFRELIADDAALALVAGLLGPGYAVSNFTANIALPGSRSMSVHSDQALVVPEPWLAPWSINIIWCLDDVTRDNGGTLYLPGSQHLQRRAELPADAYVRMRAIEAPAGAIVAMDGRVWHTSGANITTASQRALLFGYYSLDFLRPQVNFNATLSPATIAMLDARLHELLRLGPTANARIAGEVLGPTPGRLTEPAQPPDSVQQQVSRP